MAAATVCIQVRRAFLGMGWVGAGGCRICIGTIPGSYSKWRFGGFGEEKEKKMMPVKMLLTVTAFKFNLLPATFTRAPCF